MKYVHNITFSVFVKHGELLNQVSDALTKMIPFDLEKEKIKIKKTTAEGLTGSKINILEVFLEKERHTSKIIDFLKEKLSSQDIEKLKTQDNRVDEECTFFLRLDKQKAIEGEYILTDGGDCFHIKMSIAAFPKKREVAVEVVKKMLI